MVLTMCRFVGKAVFRLPVVLLVLSLHGVAAAAGGVSLRHLPGEIEQGEAFPVDLLLEQARSLSAGQVDLTFDGTKIRLMGVVFAGLWKKHSRFQALDGEKGGRVRIRFQTGAAVSGRWNIATLWFQALDKGLSPVQLENLHVVRANGDEVALTEGFQSTIRVVALRHSHRHDDHDGHPHSH